MPDSKDLKSLYKYLITTAAIWTMLFAGLLLLDVSRELENTRNLALTHGILWLLGLASLGFVSYRGRVGTVQDVTESVQAENMLRNIAEKVSIKTGAEYFRLLVEFIAREMDMEYALVGRYDSDSNKVKTIAVYAHGRIADNMTYDLHNTPCDNVVGKRPCVYREGIRDLFPEDRLLADMGAESYAGIPLFASDGHPLGIVAALGCSPMKDGNSDKLISILQIFSSRASSEMERMKTDEMLSRWAAVVMNNPAPVMQIDKDHVIILCNPAASRLFNSDPTGGPAGAFFPVFRQLEFNKISPDSPMQFEDAIGDKEFLLTVKRDQATGSLYVYGSDITQRKETERALLESEERFEGIINNVNIGVTLISPDLRVLLVNNQIKKWFGDFDDSARPLCSDVFVPLAKARTCFKCPTLKTLHDGKPHELTVDIPMGDETRFYRIISSPIKIKDGSIVSVIELLEDITEHKRMEEQLMHAQKMDSVGTLAGGVAHDFNNIITAIMGFASVLNRRLKDEDPLKVYVKQIKTATENAAALTSSLLTFSRKQRIHPVVMDLNDAVNRMGAFLQRIIGEDIEFRTILSSGHLNVRIDIGQMEQVLMNIVSNARDAMPEGGSLTISTDPVTIDRDFVQSHGYGTPGNYAVISVSDTGTGMDEKTKDKIFEPFFTTKEVNKGTGLGLSIAYGIIKQHNGYITVDSAPGKGTRLRLYLPLTSQFSQEHQRTESKVFPAVMGTETILVAEDEKMIRDLISSELAEFGYKVITAEDGEDAAIKFIENKDSIHLIVSDVVMPRKGGKDFYKEIKYIRPDTKIIFLSGYSEELMFQRESFDKNAVFIKKPVDTLKLLRTIREMLDRKSQRN